MYCILYSKDKGACKGLHFPLSPLPSPYPHPPSPPFPHPYHSPTPPPSPSTFGKERCLSQSHAYVFIGCIYCAWPTFVWIQTIFCCPVVAVLLSCSWLSNSWLSWGGCLVVVPLHDHCPVFVPIHGANSLVAVLCQLSRGGCPWVLILAAVTCCLLATVRPGIKVIVICRHVLEIH